MHVGERPRLLFDACHENFFPVKQAGRVASMPGPLIPCTKGSMLSSKRSRDQRERSFDDAQHHTVENPVWTT
jgi:hypothetical protein